MWSAAILLGVVIQLRGSLCESAYILSDEYIARIKTQQNQWQAGRNFDPDTPLSQIKVLMGTRMEGRDQFSHPVKTHDPLWPKRIPKKFDARKKWGKKCPTIKQVLDQGGYSSGWAIAATQTFTDRMCIASNGTHKERLSTANVLSCCTYCGGWELIAWDYFKNYGLPSGGLYGKPQGCQPYSIPSPCTHYGQSPYPQCQTVDDIPLCETKCTNKAYNKPIEKDRRYAEGGYVVNKDEKMIMQEILTDGPVTCAFFVHDDFLDYKSGVYEPGPNATVLGAQTAKLIGWGEQKKVPYWLVMNSWNKYWGDHGLIKMKRGSAKIGLEQEVYSGKAIYKPSERKEIQDK